MTEGQLPRTAAREQMSLARMEMIFRVGGADDYDYYNIFREGGADDYYYIIVMTMMMAMVALKFEMMRKIQGMKRCHLQGWR